MGDNGKKGTSVKVSISVPMGVMSLVKETCDREHRSISNLFTTAIIRYTKTTVNPNRDEWEDA